MNLRVISIKVTLKTMGQDEATKSLLVCRLQK